MIIIPEIAIGAGVTLVLNYIITAFSFGKVKQEITDLKKEHQDNMCSKYVQRLCTIETKIEDIDGIKDDVKRIRETLNQLVGKVDIFISLYTKHSKRDSDKE
jgi:hypothetical protein